VSETAQVELEIGPVEAPAVLREGVRRECEGTATLLGVGPEAGGRQAGIHPSFIQWVFTLHVHLVHPRAVAAQDIESKNCKRFLIFQLQALKPGAVKQIRSGRARVRPAVNLGQVQPDIKLSSTWRGPAPPC